MKGLRLFALIIVFTLLSGCAVRPLPTMQILDSSAQENSGDIAGDSLMELNLDIESEDLLDLLSGIKEKKTVPAVLYINGELFGKIGLKTKGNSSLQAAMALGNCYYPFELVLDKYENLSFDGMTSIKLNPSYFLFDMLGEYLSYRIFDMAGVPASRSGLAAVQINGKNFGLYIAVEDINRSYVKNRYENGDGWLLEASFFETIEEAGGDAAEWIETKRFRCLEIKTKQSKADAENIRARLAEMDGSKRSFRKNVDTDELMRYLAAVTVCGANDNLTDANNYYLYYGDCGFIAIPWDLDRAIARDTLSYYERSPYEDIVNTDRNETLGLLINYGANKQRYNNYILELTQQLESGDWFASETEKLIRIIESLGGRYTYTLLPISNGEYLSFFINENGEYIRDNMFAKAFEQFVTSAREGACGNDAGVIDEYSLMDIMATFGFDDEIIFSTNNYPMLKEYLIKKGYRATSAMDVYNTYRKNP